MSRGQFDSDAQASPAHVTSQEQAAAQVTPAQLAAPPQSIAHAAPSQRTAPHEPVAAHWRSQGPPLQERSAHAESAPQVTPQSPWHVSVWQLFGASQTTETPRLPAVTSASHASFSSHQRWQLPPEVGHAKAAIAGASPQLFIPLQ